METSPHPLPSRRRPKLIALIVGLAVLVLAVLGAFLMLQRPTSSAQIPKDITDWATFSLYVPSKLPSTYKVDETSFSKQEDTVVSFTARDSAGSTIYFTQQAKPKNFDFDTFYREQTTEPTTLSDVPFPTVTAKVQNNTTKVVSIVTDDTWILASSQAPLSESDMKTIAQGMQKY